MITIIVATYLSDHDETLQALDHSDCQQIAVTDNASIMTIHFYAPIYMLLTLCDREPERENEALRLLEEHIRQFDKLYGRNF